MASIVVIEDEPDIQDVLSFNLEDSGHQVVVASSGKDGLALIRDATPPPDLVVLDLMLPDLSGLQVCRKLKQGAATRNVSIIMLTAKGEEVDRIVGFELGADDYVTKPFSVRELMLRVDAVLRRRGPVERPNLEVGALRVDRAARRVWVGAREVTLSVMELKLLLHLCDHPEEVQSRDVLYKAVWGHGGPIASRSLDTHVKSLRAKLGDAGAYIHTVRGWGYRFDAPDDDG